MRHGWWWRIGCVLWLLILPCGAGAAPYELAGGLVAMEAEAFSNSVSRSGRAWELRTDGAGYSATGFMVVTNGNASASNINVAVATTCPELQYGIIFPAVGTYYLWVRGWGMDGTEDSVHLGVDGGLTTASSNLTWSSYGAWVWTNGTAGGAARSIAVGSTGVHTLSLWMREDGARVDRLVVTTNAAFQPRVGNAWHQPANSEPAVGFMRSPILEIYSNTTVTIYNGNQFQGGPNAGNQLGSGSTLYYRNATGTAWTAVAMTFQATSDNNKYFAGVIPANTFPAGTVVHYYLRVPYDNFLPTYLAESNGVAFETELEQVAQAHPYSYSVRATPAPGSPSPDDWRNENVYFLMTDRFFDGDPANNTADPFSGYDPAASTRLHGGDLKGLEQKLDYLRALGATAIWITPIPHNTSNRAYHGYSAYNFYELAPQLGTTNELVSLVASAHARGIKVILDIVANHAGRIIDSGDAGFPAYNYPAGYSLRWTEALHYPPPFDQVDFFHPYGDVGTYVDPDQILGDLRGLDDLRTETLAVRTNLVEIYKHWIRVADLDGFRIDTVKHVEMGFWQYFGQEIRAFAHQMGKTNFITFGECFDSSDAKVGSYTGTQAGGPYALDSVVDYPLYDKMNSVFALGTGNTKQLEDRYNALPANYDAAARDRLVTFLDNHDNDRFLSSGLANNNTGRLALALSFLYTSRGIPCLYYGTEQNFNGGNDPDNREDMFDGEFEQGPSLGDNFDQTHGTFLQVARLNNFRRLYPALRTGDHVNRWNTSTGPGLFAYARRTTNQEILVVFNTAATSQTLTNRNTSYAPGTVLVNLFDTNEAITVTASTNTPVIAVPAGSTKMFVARAQWRPLDPVVVQQSPAHGASNQPVAAPIVLKFSKPMETNLTAAAFQLDPPASGTLVWSSNQTVLTFTPSMPAGLVGHTRYRVRVDTQAVDVVDQLHLFAPYESFLDTGSTPDVDADGIPDWWMQQWFGHAEAQAGDLSRPGDDADGDGFSNEAEYLALTDPGDEHSFLHITQITSDGVVLPTAAGRRYNLEAGDAVAQAWEVLVTNYPGTGSPLLLPEPAEGTARWFRVRATLP